MNPRRRGVRRAAGVVLAALVGLAGGCEREPQFESLAFPGAPGSGQPRLTSDLDGTPLLSWIEPDGDFDRLLVSRIGVGGAAPPSEVVRSERMFVNWADYPSVTPITATLWFAHWLRLQPDSRGAYDVATAISQDGGASWTGAEQMNEDETAAEHGFVSVFDWSDEIAAFWLDGRELANWSFDEPDALLGTSLRLARYADDGSVLRREIADALVCDCCQPDTAMTAAGPIVIYRDRTENEIRDVLVRRFTGDGWSEPVGVGAEGWFIEGCPVNGPVVAARGQDVVAAWFTAANGHSRVRFARSGDAGASFSGALDIETRGALGQPGIVLDDDRRALVSWWRRGTDGGIDLMARRVEPDGTLGTPLTVAHETVGQPVAVPQLVAFDEAYLLAWSSFDDNGTVRLQRVLPD